MKLTSPLSNRSPWSRSYVQTLKEGGLGIICTDTIYGIIGLAKNEKTVRRMYRLKKRNPKKPFIILISSMEDLADFGVTLSVVERDILEKFWPGPVSIILPTRKVKSLQYLHRGTNQLAFRLPRQKRMQDLLHRTGPLIAPSANPEGLPPAENISDAKRYFGDRVDVYIRGGRRRKKPSTIISVLQGSVTVIRS